MHGNSWLQNYCVEEMPLGNVHEEVVSQWHTRPVTVENFKQLLDVFVDISFFEGFFNSRISHQLTHQKWEMKGKKHLLKN